MAASSGPLVGRAAEREAVAAALQALHDGAGGVVAIEGEPGNTLSTGRHLAAGDWARMRGPRVSSSGVAPERSSAPTTSSTPPARATRRQSTC